MAAFKFVIAEKGKCYQIEKDQKDCEALLGLKIGSKIPGDVLGMAGYEFQITGGTDIDGFPMRKDVDGTVKKRMLLKRSVGFGGKKRKKKKLFKIKGMRKGKTIRGNTIDEHIAQINCKVIKRGEKNLEEFVEKEGKKDKK